MPQDNEKGADASLHIQRIYSELQRLKARQLACRQPLASAPNFSMPRQNVDIRRKAIVRMMAFMDGQMQGKSRRFFVENRKRPPLGANPP